MRYHEQFDLSKTSSLGLVEDIYKTQKFRKKKNKQRSFLSITCGVTAVTPTDRPKSVRNRCVIEVFSGVFCVVMLDFSVSVGAFVIGLSQISSFFLMYMYWSIHSNDISHIDTETTYLIETIHINRVSCKITLVNIDWNASSNDKVMLILLRVDARSIIRCLMSHD